MTTKKESPRSTKSVLSMTGRGLAGVSAVVIAIGAAFALAYFALPSFLAVTYSDSAATTTPASAASVPPLDTLAYNLKLLELAHVATSSPWYTAFLEGTTTITMSGTTTPTKVVSKLWPARAAYPQDSRALLPAHRIVAYYGNFYSTGMGVLGQYPEGDVIAKLKAAVAEWQAADPSTPVVPAIEYIDVTAQGSAGKDGKYRARMPDSQIDKALEYAKQINGIVILDIQVGLSTVQDELPLIHDYLAMPDVHLAIDPEFSMKDGVPPGHEIGTMNSADVNYAINYLSGIVKANNLPPKILVVHRFTEDMVTGAKNIVPTPQVEVVMNMDGWGFPAKKINTYNSVIYPEPVQFTGIKLFYKNDLLPPSTGMLTPAEVLNLTPAPIYVQYQ
ncbi:MAG: hypothetical protein KGH79_04620 [Patescibacteria group bacterium]|nr:hypothetical protein [Patescibacteria group bacterium]